MAVIERITGSGDTNAVIYFSDRESIQVPKDLIYQFGLRKGDSPDDSVLNELLTEAEKLKIETAALRFLAIRHHSEFELNIKLQKKKFPKELINSVFDRLRAAGFLDDTRFAELYAAECITLKHDGLQKVKANLIKRGVKQLIISSVLSAYEINEEYTEQLAAIAAKKLASLKRQKKDVRQIRDSLTRYLLGKGYEFQAIRNCLNSLNLETGDMEQS